MLMDLVSLLKNVMARDGGVMRDGALWNVLAMSIPLEVA